MGLHALGRQPRLDIGQRHTHVPPDVVKAIRRSAISRSAISRRTNRSDVFKYSAVSETVR
jgi:L-rhamnose mutarotase